MPNRILRDWTDSEQVDNLSVNAERFFTRLIMKVDDYGRFSANVKLLNSILYPLKTNIRETDISLWLAECEKNGLISLYNVSSKDYLEIVNFKQTLRIRHEKHPGKPENIDILGHDTHMHSTCIADDMLKRNETETKRNEKNSTKTEFSIDWDKLLINYNQIFKRSNKVINQSIKNSFIARLKEGYTKNDILNSMVNAEANSYHREMKHLHCTLKFFARADILDKYREVKKDTIKQNVIKIDTE